MAEESYEDIFGSSDEVEEKPAPKAVKKAAPVKAAPKEEVVEEEEEEQDAFVAAATKKPAAPAPKAKPVVSDDVEDLNFLGAQTNEAHDLSAGQGPLYKFMQWVEPDPKAAMGSFQNLGGFFLPEEQFPFGFTPSRKLNKITFDNGSSQVGLGFPKIMVSIIGYRLDWFSKGGDKRTFYKSYDEGIKDAGKKNLRGRTRYVVLVKNEDLWKYGPLMITVSGIKGRTLQSAVSSYDTNLRRTLERKFSRKFAPYCFWCPLKPGERVKISEEYNKYATSPALALPEKFDAVEIGKKAFVGKEVIEACEGYWDEVQEWSKASTSGDHGEPQMALAEEVVKEEAPKKLEEFFEE